MNCRIFRMLARQTRTTAKSVPFVQRSVAPQQLPGFAIDRRLFRDLTPKLAPGF